ncbi:MAG: type II and III secretion system protein [Bryobacteraceae bacterium]
MYSEAAAKDPGCVKYWQRADALRTQAALAAKPLPPMPPSPDGADTGIQTPETPPFTDSLDTTLSDEDLRDLQRLLPPPDLVAISGKKTLDLHGDARSLFHQTAEFFGLDTVFDGDYELGGANMHIHLTDVDYREALRAIETATNSFAVPLTSHLILVVHDTPEKRAAVEPTVAVSIPIPETVTVQQAQELGRSVQLTMDIAKFSIDGDRHTVLFRDRISKVRPAQLLFEQLAQQPPQVELELQFLEVDRSFRSSYGLLLPSSFTISPVNLNGTGLVALAAIPFLSANSFSVSIANAELLAQMTRSNSKTLYQSVLRSVSGEAATLTVGQKYPIMNGTFFGGTPLGVPPSFTYEDLGVKMKITPIVQGADQIALDVSAEFELLSGQSVNGIPVLANRKLEGKVALRAGEWAVVAGLMSPNDSTTITGIPILSSIPLIGRVFRRNDINRSDTEVLILIKPRLAGLPPGEDASPFLFVGSEGKLQIPL